MSNNTKQEELVDSALSKLSLEEVKAIKSVEKERINFEVIKVLSDLKEKKTPFSVESPITEMYAFKDYIPLSAIESIEEEYRNE